jgi:hypothetical protein
MAERLRRQPDRLLILARRARRFAGEEPGLLADLYREHAAICEGKAADQAMRRKKMKRTAKSSED